MDKAQRHQSRLDRIRQYKSASHDNPLAIPSPLALSICGDEDNHFIEANNVSVAYREHINEYEVSLTDAEIAELIANLEVENGANAILEPVLLGLFDGTIRAFNLGAKQGITATRLYQECKVFSYSDPDLRSNTQLDSYTEYRNEQANIASFDSKSKYYEGSITRDGKTINMRDGNKINKIKSKHFDEKMTAADGYDPNSVIYANKVQAKKNGVSEQAAEADHANSCLQVCNKLKSNKALTVNDIKDIINIEDNIVITSKKNNAGGNKSKNALTRDQLQKQVNQGYALNKDGKKKIPLTDDDKAIKARQIQKMDEAQVAIDKKTNETVWKNVKGNKDVQKQLATDAGKAAGHQLLGEVFLFAIKPLYYELNDCIRNGIEEGVSANDFGTALKIRFGRMKVHVIERAATLLKDGLLSFFRNFLSMLLEGIVNCFVGVFKQVARIVKEGVKILLQIAPILKDANKSPAQKGDAILKLIAGSITIFAGVAFETWLNNISIGEPWSIVLSSVMSAVLTTLTMFVLDKIDLFNVNKGLRAQRVSEALNLKIENTEYEIINSLALLT